MNIKRSIVTRVRLAFLAICLFAFAIIYKVGYIQIKDGDRWREIANEKRFHYQPVFATRGNIYSNDDRIMATSLPFYRVAFDPTISPSDIFSKGIDSLAIQLSRFYGDRSPSYYKQKIKNARSAGRKYVRLNGRLINYQDKKMMAKWPIFRAGKNKGGVIFEKLDRRFLPFGSLAKRTIGFINEDRNGAGLEFSFNRHLAGKDGEALYERMAGGNKPINDGTEVKPMPGFDIQTTIDINLQDVAENALNRALTLNDAAHGCVILMEVSTGHIKAIANLGRQAEGVYAEDYNYAVGNQGRTEPGSTFKLASMMALLEETDMSLNDTIDTGNGSERIGGAVKTDTHGNGRISLQQVFEKSSNIGVAKLIQQTFEKDPQKYVDYLHKFGLHQPLGFQMNGEAVPYIKSPKDRSWSRPSLSTMAIGYELKISPLQTLAFYNAVANNGVKVQPMIVKSIKRADQILESYEAKILNPKICSDQTLVQLRQMMEGVVENGTAKNLKSKDYKVAGKTGTARKVINGQYTRKYSTSFVGYFPADRPKYSCIVIIDSPQKNAQYGGDVAAPVFRELADKAYAQDLAIHAPMVRKPVGVQPKLPVLHAGSQEELTILCNKLGVSAHPLSPEEDWVRVDTQKQSVALKPVPVKMGQVPDVTDMTLKDALYLLGNHGIKVRAIGLGRVESQSIPPGQPVAKGTIITITLTTHGATRKPASGTPVNAIARAF
ncbi:penicillin-binding protein [Rufibacter hautae]|uniref:Transpeptidase family protein n=1 Tax=Rufibacter hautae TaxID=2595005 RepID=A0A5B6TDT5_9BACT|nr:penicillin-binding protein [Rufibacter hautae]KAA3437544.1 transpeptidase family protein [Rufibacter hautae]